MSSDSLLARRFHGEISEMLASGFIGGSSKLYELERLARQCRGELKGGERTVCDGLADLLDRIAKLQEGEAVLDDDASKLCEAIAQPLVRCTDYLIGRDSGADPARLLGDLTETYANWRAPRSA